MAIEVDQKWNEGDLLKLIQDVLDDVQFDCGSHLTGNPGENIDACLNKTANIRRDLAPLVRGHLDDIFLKLKEYFDLMRVNASSSEIDRACSYLAPLDHGVYDFFDNINRTNRDLLMSLLVKNFRAHGLGEQFFRHLNRLGSTSHNHSREARSDGDAHDYALRGIAKCKEMYQSFSSASRAAVFTFLNQYLDRSPFSLGNLYIRQKKHFSNEKTANLLSMLVHVKEDLFGTNNITYQDVLTYISGSVVYLKTLPSKFSACMHWHELDDECKIFAKEINSNYKRVLKLMKYTIESLSWRKTSGESIKDHTAALKTLSTRYVVKDVGSRHQSNFRPLLVACKFGPKDEALSPDCHMFKKTYTMKGIAYAFNSASVIQLLKDTDWTHSFHQEMNQGFGRPRDRGQENSSDTSFPLSNGPRYGLELLLQVPSNGRSVSIQEPKNIPDLTGQVVTTFPGKHVSIQVTPTKIESTDELINNFDPRVRKCLAKEETSQLSILAKYSSTNCVFDCNLAAARAQCGCIPWNFPRWDKATPMCSPLKDYCFRKIMEAMDFQQCRHCLPDCETIHYKYNIKVLDLEPGEVHQMCGEPMRNSGPLREAVKKSFAQHRTIPSASELLHKPVYQAQCRTFVRKKLAKLSVYIEPPLAMR